MPAMYRAGVAQLIGVVGVHGGDTPTESHAFADLHGEGEAEVIGLVDLVDGDALVEALTRRGDVARVLAAQHKSMTKSLPRAPSG